MKNILYDRKKAVAYAIKWAKKRNPKYYDFSSIGGDCTNFVSQCVYAGVGVMNYRLSTGWFYSSPSLRAPSWTGVNEFYRFAVNNNSYGFYAELCNKSELELGDVIQLGRTDDDFYHTLIVSEIDKGKIFVCSHSRDFLSVPLETFPIMKIRFLHVLGARSE